MVRSYHPTRKINGASLIGLFKRSSVDRPLTSHDCVIALQWLLHAPWMLNRPWTAAVHDAVGSTKLSWSEPSKAAIHDRSVVCNLLA